VDASQSSAELIATDNDKKPATVDAKPAVDVARLLLGASTVVADNFIKNSIITSQHQLAVGDHIVTRFCSLHGVVTFTSLPATTGRECVAHLDPNYRDPDTGIPYCFPMSARIFFASVVDSESSAIQRLVAIRLEPHGRLVVLGNEAADLKIRLDNIAFQPLMKANTAPSSCAPYCFPIGLLDQSGLGVAGCVKYCEPLQDVQQDDFSKEPSPCKCAIVKRLACFLHEGSDLTTCGQFKMLMSMRSVDKWVDAEACEQICAGQVSAF
jgi:hypothetical protein